MSGLPLSWTEPTDKEKTLTEEERAFRRGFDHAISSVKMLVRYLAERDALGLNGKLPGGELPDGKIGVSEVLFEFEAVSHEFRVSEEPKAWYSQQVRNEVAERLGIEVVGAEGETPGRAEPDSGDSEKQGGATSEGAPGDETDE